MLQVTKTLSFGDPAPLFVLPDRQEDRLFLANQAGKPTILFFYAKDEIPECRDIAYRFRDLMPTWTELDIQILGISLNSPESRQQFATENNIPFPLLSDINGYVSKQYGLIFETLINNSPVFTYTRTAILLDINLCILRIYPLSNWEVAINELLKDIKTLLRREEPRHITMQAPVLLIPNVLEEEFCRELIHVWSTQGNGESGSMRQEGEKTIGVIDYNRKIRRDHFISDERLLKALDRIMQRRVFTQIRKAFQFEVTRREDYRIGCYDAAKGGFFRPHRDNTTGGTAHRRFAMSLNLNSDRYEGGYLRFPEYGPHLYKPETGSAVIFSCSLLHEATDIISGCRFVLLSFFYGEKEAAEREAYESKVQNDYKNLIKIS
ncbi:redoxin domain-containing protein [Aerosakkonema funiforme]|uniref:redoxin domain-containing protein n=1 Tax=Aerosakkonema funiforme TaxID=1246630 RepID=UPI0035B8ED22